MSLKKEIIEQYTNADEDQRLGLYLMHRGFREDFMEIDMKEASAAAPTVESSTRRKFGDCCLGWLRLGRAH